MIRGKKTMRPAEERIDRTHLCDFCGKDTEKRPTWHDRSEATIEALSGDVYDDGDMRDRTSLDVCHECFFEKVVPAIEALGVKFRKRDANDYSHVDEWEMP